MASNMSVTERYVAIWNEADADKRRDLIGETFTEDAVYEDPLLAGEGLTGLAAMFDGVRAQLPGARVALAGKPDAHHDWVRFSWELRFPGSEESDIEGTDVGRIGPDGRFQQIIGFLDKVPAALAS